MRTEIVRTVLGFPRRIILAVALLTILVLVGGVWFYRAQEQLLRARAESDLQAIAKLKVDQIVALRTGQLADAAVIMDSPFFSRGLSEWMKTRDPVVAAGIRTRFRAVQAHYQYDDIVIVTPEGATLLTLSEIPITLAAATVEDVGVSLRERRPVLSELRAGPGDSSPHLEAIAPVFDPDDDPTIPVGAVILRRDARQLIYPVIQSWPTDSSSAETLLVRQDGDSALFLNDLRHRQNTALALRFPLADTTTPAVRAVLGQEGIIQARDYRGVDVLAVLKPIPNSSWYIVAKVDTDETFSAWRQTSALIIATLLGLIVACAAAAGLIWQRNSRVHLERLLESEVAHRKSESRYRTTLYSVGDGVIATDAEGRVEVMNAVAESLTGWTQDQARGRPLADVFVIVNEETRQPAQSPVDRCLREGAIVGLANHTVLISRDGTEYPIADSGAPIRTEDGITGVVLVFRDQTDERRAAEALLQTQHLSQVLLDAFPCIAMLMHPSTREVVASNEVARNAGAVTGATSYPAAPDHATPCPWSLPPEVWEEGRSLHLEVESDGTWWDAHWVPVSPDLYMHFAFDVTERKHAEIEHARLQDQLTQAQKMEAVGRLAGGVAHDFNNMLGVIIGHADLALMEMSPTDPHHHDLQEIARAAERSAALTRQLLAFARRQIVAPKVVDLNEAVGGTLNMLRRLVGEDVEVKWVPGRDLWNIHVDPSQLDQVLANLIVNARDAISGVGRITIETANVTFDEAYCADHIEFTPGRYAMLAVSDSGVGITPDVIAHIFEPFFTTKRSTGGTGLGLATVYGIVKQNGGFINVYSEPGKGSTFKIYFARYESEVVDTPVPAAQLATSQKSQTVLIVEDEPSILQLARTILDRLGYAVLAAGSPAEALAIVRANSVHIDLLMTDVVMPEMNGRDLAQEIRALRPGIRCLFMSGYTANVIAHHGVLDDGVLFIQKPFSVSELSEKIQEALSA